MRCVAVAERPQRLFSHSPLSSSSVRAERVALSAAGHRRLSVLGACRAPRVPALRHARRLCSAHARARQRRAELLVDALQLHLLQLRRRGRPGAFSLPARHPEAGVGHRLAHELEPLRRLQNCLARVRRRRRRQRHRRRVRYRAARRDLDVHWELHAQLAVESARLERQVWIVAAPHTSRQIRFT